MESLNGPQVPPHDVLCPDCGFEVSATAPECPCCGFAWKTMGTRHSPVPVEVPSLLVGMPSLPQNRAASDKPVEAFIHRATLPANAPSANVKSVGESSGSWVGSLFVILFLVVGGGLVIYSAIHALRYEAQHPKTPIVAEPVKNPSAETRRMNSR